MFSKMFQLIKYDQSMAKYRNLSFLCFCYQRRLDASTDALFIGIYCLLLFNVGALSNAYRVLTQIRLSVVMSHSRQVDPLSIASAQTMVVNIMTKL